MRNLCSKKFPVENNRHVWILFVVDAGLRFQLCYQRVDGLLQDFSVPSVPGRVVAKGEVLLA